MISKGIKSRILLGKRAGINTDSNNGYFYVSLSKNEPCEMSIHHKLSGYPMFVISGNIKPLKAQNFRRYGRYPMWCSNSPLPFRECEYDDEYQKFLQVLSKDILAIQYNIFSNYQEYDNNGDYMRNQLLVLQSIIRDLDFLKIDLPVIDGSTSAKINKEKVLFLKI